MARDLKVTPAVPYERLYCFGDFDGDDIVRLFLQDYPVIVCLTSDACRRSTAKCEARYTCSVGIDVLLSLLQ
jgi:hypothetical protein